MRLVAGAFIVLHGLVHAMYVGQAMRWFELREGMAWPTGSRLMRSVPDDRLRRFAAITIGMGALLLIGGGIGILLDAGWGPGVTVAGAVLASIVHILLWSGNVKTAPDEGLYGVIINVVIVVGILVAG
jgi:hypothetical protein